MKYTPIIAALLIRFYIIFLTGLLILVSSNLEVIYQYLVIIAILLYCFIDPLRLDLVSCGFEISHRFNNKIIAFLGNIIFFAISLVLLLITILGFYQVAVAYFLFEAILAVSFDTTLIEIITFRKYTLKVGR